MSYLMESPSEGRRIEQKTNRGLTLEQLQWAGVRSGQKVLDLGCAAGTTCRLLAERVGAGGRVVGIDTSAARLAEARRHPDHRPWIEYREGVATALPARDGEFDLSWSRFLFEYLPDPLPALREMVRVTRPGGTVAVADLDGNCIWHDPYPQAVAADIERALSDLAGVGFDPHVGRKLFHLARTAGLTQIEVDIRPYHLIAGKIDPVEEGLWDQKIRTVRDQLVKLGWSSHQAERLYRGFIGHLRDESSFTYSVLITVKGRRPM